MSPVTVHWVVLGGAFVIFWFLALQIVIPLGVSSPHETLDKVEPGHDPGAPVRPRLGLKIAIATGAAAVLWAILYALILGGILDL